MAFARIAVFPRGTKEQYELIGNLMGEGVMNQLERRLLASGPSEAGWEIIQIWDSKEALDRFVEEHLRPAFERAGERGFPEPPEITDFELFDLYM